MSHRHNRDDARRAALPPTSPCCATLAAAAVYNGDYPCDVSQPLLACPAAMSIPEKADDCQYVATHVEFVSLAALRQLAPPRLAAP